jgi:hypothetical protein
MQFSVAAGDVDDPSTPPADLQMPAIPALDPTVTGRFPSTKKTRAPSLFAKKRMVASLSTATAGNPSAPPKLPWGR